jgi:hypothetical protein
VSRPQDGAPPRLFISYRVADTLQLATALHRELERCLGSEAVFLDHRTIEPGEPWPDRLRREVETASVVLVLIGTRWLTIQGEHGIRRLDQIEVALKAGKFVLPILVDGAHPLDADAFVTEATKAIVALASLQAIELRSKAWEPDFDRLLTILERHAFHRPHPAASAGSVDARARRPFRSTVPTRGRAPFLGRDRLLEEIVEHLRDPSATELVVLHGPPGVGKSELAREYARRNQSRYPGGTFVVDVSSSGPPVDLARLGIDVWD